MTQTKQDCYQIGCDLNQQDMIFIEHEEYDYRVANDIYRCNVCSQLWEKGTNPSTVNDRSCMAVAESGYYPEGGEFRNV